MYCLMYLLFLWLYRYAKSAEIPQIYFRRKQTSMKKRILVLLAVLALVITCMAFAAQAATFDLATFKCPCSACEAERDKDANYVKPTSEWATSLSNLENGSHVYLSANTSVGTLSVSEGKEVVVVLDNKYLLFTTTSARSMLINGAGAKLHLIGTTSNSVVMSKTKTTNNGAFAQVSTGAELHLYGTLHLKMHGSAGPQPTSSGMIKLSNGKLHLHDAEAMGMGVSGAPRISASTLAGTGSSNQGGICKLEDSNCVFTMDAGTLEGAVISMSGLGTDVPKHRVGRGGLLYNKGGIININGGTLKGAGSVTGSGTVSRGGLIYNEAGTLNITGGTFTADTKMTGDYRGICVAGGTVNFSGGTITSANVSQGDGIGMLSGTLTISGTATVLNAKGTHDNNIFRWSTASATSNKMTPATIQVDKDWTGSASIDLPGHGKTSLDGSILSDYVIFGKIVDGEFVANAGTTKALSLYLEDASFEYPQLHGTAQYICASRSALKADGKVVSWHLTPQGAINAYAKAAGADKHVKLWANYTNKDNDTTVTGEVYIDLNGYDQTDFALQEGGKIYAFDSKAKAGNVGATINVEAEAVTEFGGKTYINLTADGTTTVYPVEYKLTSISLRAKNEAVYYTASLKANAALGATMGVAVTVVENEPSAESLAEYLYTEDANNKGVYTGVLVKDILSEATLERANKLIKARAYIKVGEELFMSELKQYSLTDVVNMVIQNNIYAGMEADSDVKVEFETLYGKLANIDGIELVALVPEEVTPSEPEDETV